MEKEDLKRKLKSDYENACNNYLMQLLNDWKVCGYWVGDEIGGVYCFNDDYFIGLNDIIYCVDNDIELDSYIDFSDYIVRCDKYNLDSEPFKCFIEKGPTYTEEEFNMLDERYKYLSDAINEMKAKAKTSN